MHVNVLSVPLSVHLVTLWSLSLACLALTCLFISYRSSLHPTWDVNSQLRLICAQPSPRHPTAPPAPLTTPTQPILQSLWAPVKALLARSPRALDTPRPHTALLSGQDPQVHARSACLTPRSHYHSTSRPQRSRCPFTKATTWDPRRPPRSQSAKEGPTCVPRSPVRHLD